MPPPMQPSPAWGSEPLTDFIQGSTQNAWATYLHPEARELVQHAQRIDEVLVEAISLMSGPNAQFIEALMLANATLIKFGPGTVRERSWSRRWRTSTWRASAPRHECACSARGMCRSAAARPELNGNPLENRPRLRMARSIGHSR